MTRLRSGSATRALVLGGGGAIGLAWQAGLLSGLQEAGLDLTAAEAIVGTSAGAFIGALLACGHDVADALQSLTALRRSADPQRLAAAHDAFSRARRTANLATDSRQALQVIGQAAREARTSSQELYLELFDALAGTAWPAGFRCTATDVDTGELVVWDKESGVTLQEAVASSCVVPMLFPVMTLATGRFMDGGILNPVNAIVVPPSDVLVVISCHPLSRHTDRLDAAQDAMCARVTAELAAVAETTRLVLIEPDFSEMGETQNMMDASMVTPAFQIGTRQAQHDVASIGASWNI